MKSTLLFVAAAALTCAATALALSPDPDPDAGARRDGLALAALPEAPPLLAAPAPPRPPQPSDRMAAGVEVRGMWVVEVREPDGSLVERRDFHNAYTDPDNFLAWLITRVVSPGSPSIVLGNTVNDQNVCGSAQTPAGCVMVRPEAADFFAVQSPTLTVVVSNWKIVLSGTAIATRDGSIATVQTGMLACPGDVAPLSCVGAETDHFFLTAHTLDAPIAIANGQQVLARVELSFGPAD